MFKPVYRYPLGSHPVIPTGTSIYIIGDIHGRADLLSTAFNSIDDDINSTPSNRTIQVFLGDYIDRGASSFETIELLINRSRNFEVVFLKGNHEALFQRAMSDPSSMGLWASHGGVNTMASYGVRPNLKGINNQMMTARMLEKHIPDHHKVFFSSLLLSFTYGDYFFVHAGVRPNIPLELQIENDLLWIRNDFLNYQSSFGKYIVHGHSPVLEVEIKTWRANIDTGAYATSNLTTLKLVEDRMYVDQTSPTSLDKR